jgi:hypothetical protein
MQAQNTAQTPDLTPKFLSDTWSVMIARPCWFLVLLFALGLAGCASPMADLQTASYRQVSEQTTCEAMAPSSCSGTYGFTVDSLGNFTAGPSPSGMVLKGSITANESSALNAAAEAYLASTGPSASCQVRQSVPGVSDVVRITSNNSQTIDVFDEGMQTTGNCVTADSAKAAALTTQIQQLRQKYYPIPFPT